MFYQNLFAITAFHCKVHSRIFAPKCKALQRHRISPLVLLDCGRIFYDFFDIPALIWIEKLYTFYFCGVLNGNEWFFGVHYPKYGTRRTKLGMSFKFQFWPPSQGSVCAYERNIALQYNPAWNRITLGNRRHKQSSSCFCGFVYSLLQICLVHFRRICRQNAAILNIFHYIGISNRTK